MLYVVATPIGNLSDMTYRAVETLQKCDYILCEDTRHSSVLLNHYQIKKPLKSFHKFNETEKENTVIHDLENGLAVGLISDAGTPGISDPGSQLIARCIHHGLNVTAIPGPCAAITALSSSGLDSFKFQFYGFLPKKEGELKAACQEILSYTGTTICYEAPNRLIDTLNMIGEIAPLRKLVVARELTKKFEEIQRGVAHELIAYFKRLSVKGEIVLLISGETINTSTSWEHLTPHEHVEWMEKTYLLTKKDAIIAVANLRNVSKRDIYNKIHKL